MQGPTLTQQKLLDEIINYIEQTGSSPTVRYLATKMNWKSTNGVRNMLAVLTRKGHLLATTPDNRRISLSSRYRTVVVRPEGDNG